VAVSQHWTAPATAVHVLQSESCAHFAGQELAGVVAVAPPEDAGAVSPVAGGGSVGVVSVVDGCSEEAHATTKSVPRTRLSTE